MSTRKAQGERPFRVYDGSSLGTAIKHYRRQAGLTQEQLAEQAGISRSYLSRLEHGHQTEQVKHILALLRQLGVRMTLEHADW
jgi:HTH-type transcriptional regulator/antitoxin HipB